MSTETWEPKIIGFLCNWCGYAGADLAGTSRIRYPSNIRIIRVMCSGRVDPTFILEALEKGADGVLVAACHLGDCHYQVGNQYAEKRIETTKKVLYTLGLGPERLRLEWVSAAEGVKFASVIRDFTEKLRDMGSNPLKTNAETPGEAIAKESIRNILNKTKASYCQECGKCSSNCPITEISPDYSPRLIVEKALIGLDQEVIQDQSLWSCLTCYLCRERCPLDIEYDELMRSLRAEAKIDGINGHCSHGGILPTLSNIMTKPGINQNRLNWLPEGSKTSKNGEMLYFVGCLPYFDNILTHIDVNNIEIAQSTVRILNKAGIEPMLLSNERCCGHDASFTGDRETFKKLAKLNVEAIRESHASKVVTACAECYRTIKVDYAELFGNLGFEVQHTSELLAELIDEGKIEFTNELKNNVVYHDPCRLGRHMGIYEEPRKVISSIPGLESVEMDRSRENSLCCGVNAWMNCGKTSKQIQMDRLSEAKGTGADLLITACPKCQIHLNCAMGEKLPIGSKEVTLETSDLSVLAARAMNLAQIEGG